MFVNDVIENYVRIDGISVPVVDSNIEMINEYETTMRGTPVFTCARMKIILRTAEIYKPEPKQNKLYDLILKCFYRNGSISRIEIKDAFLLDSSFESHNLTFELSHLNDDNCIVDYY